jgi:hypothetical protein
MSFSFPSYNFYYLLHRGNFLVYVLIYKHDDHVDKRYILHTFDCSSSELLCIYLCTSDIANIVDNTATRAMYCFTLVSANFSKRKMGEKLFWFCLAKIPEEEQKRRGLMSAIQP